ncbi:MAG: PP2C family protein-serine/threonine phosphatase [Pseudobdellovibrionaceae bacterium]
MSIFDDSSLSLRAKILMALVGLPSVVLGVVLYLTVKTFEEDKIAYIFETATTVTGSLATEVENELKAIQYNVVQTSALINLETRKWNNLAQNFFSDTKNLEALLVFDPDDKTNFRPHRFVNYLEKQAEQGFSAIFLSHEDIDHWIEDVQKNNVLFTFDEELNGFVVGIKHKNMVLLGFSRDPRLVREIKRPGPYALSVIDYGGKALVQGDDTQASLPITKLRDEIQKIINDKVMTKTMSVEKADGTMVLVSYKHIPSLRLLVFSFIDQREALHMFFSILRKSLLLFIMMLGVSVIIAIILSEKITTRLYELFLATRQISDGDFDVRIDVRGHDEVGRLAREFNLMAMEIQSLIQQTEGKVRMENELKTAQLVQSTFMPATDIDYGNIKISGKMEPASECGGDWWFHFRVDNKVYFMIGDVTGHGVSSALMTSAIRTVFDCLQAGMQSPAVVLDFVNKSLCRIFKGNSMMTFFLGELELETRVLVYSNASHEPPLVMTADKKIIKRKDLIPLQDGVSKRLGESPEAIFKEGVAHFQPQDRIFLFTDGILDLQDDNEVTLGERRLHELLCRVHGEAKPLPITTNDLLDAFKEHQTVPLKDDITFFIVEIG